MSTRVLFRCLSAASRSAIEPVFTTVTAPFAYHQIPRSHESLAE